MDIQEIAGVVPDSVIQNFARVLGVEIDEGMDIDDSSHPKPGGFEPIRKQVKFLMREGYSAGQIISQVGSQSLLYNSIQTCFQLHDLVIFHPTLNGRKKSACALVFAEADKALCDGADEELWVLEVGLRVHKAASA